MTTRPLYPVLGVQDIEKLARKELGLAEGAPMTGTQHGALIALLDFGKQVLFAEYRAIEFGKPESPVPFNGIDAAIAHAVKNIRGFDKQLRYLCASGNVIPAIKHARAVKGWSLKEAKEYVDKLRGAA